MSATRKVSLLLAATIAAVLLVSGIALGAQGTPATQTSQWEASFAALPADRYKIHSNWYVRYPGKYIPLRLGYHASSGKGFGYRHIKAQRGWNTYIKGRMYNTLRKGRLEEDTGTRRKVAWTAPDGCVWRAIYDLRIPSGRDREFGIVTFYYDTNNRKCP